MCGGNANIAFVEIKLNKENTFQRIFFSILNIKKAYLYFPGAFVLFVCSFCGQMRCLTCSAQLSRHKHVLLDTNLLEKSVPPTPKC